MVLQQSEYNRLNITQNTRLGHMQQKDLGLIEYIPF